MNYWTVYAYNKFLLAAQPIDHYANNIIPTLMVVAVRISVQKRAVVSNIYLVTSYTSVGAFCCVLGN